MQHANTDEDWVSIGDLARMLGCHPDTIVRWERRGFIPRAYREPLTGRRLWPRSAADEIVRKVLPDAC